MLQRIPCKPADPSKKCRVHRPRGFAVHQQHGGSICIHFLLERGIHDWKRSWAYINRFAVVELCIWREDSAIGRESKPSRRDELNYIQVAPMKLYFVTEFLDERNVQTSISFCLDTKLADLVQICLRSFEAIPFTSAFECGIAALELVSHHQIEVAVRQLRQSTTS